MKIDLVYLWVEDNEEIVNKRNQYYKKKNDYKQIWDKNSYFQLNELKYSFRSVDKYMMSFIENIYIVTDNQKPSFINFSHPNIFIIDHKDIAPLQLKNLYCPELI